MLSSHIQRSLCTRRPSRIFRCEQECIYCNASMASQPAISTLGNGLVIDREHICIVSVDVPIAADAAQRTTSRACILSRPPTRVSRPRAHCKAVMDTSILSAGAPLLCGPSDHYLCMSSALMRVNFLSLVRALHHIDRIQCTRVRER